MSNELIGKNIGHATAYAYAKAHGYEGTEEDFAQMLANYDTLVEQASGYAKSAGESASEASGYADDASASATAADQAVQRISGITASTTVAGMTDTTKVYVYLGSETGYTSGNWYYYSGSAWVSGGVYQSTALVTDTTLTQSGMAADAKATGDEVADLKEDLSKYGANNVVPVISGTSYPSTLTFVADGKGNYTISGTSTSVVHKNIFSSSSSFPAGISAGDTVLGVFESTNSAILFYVMWYVNGSKIETEANYMASGYKYFSIPSNATGMEIRITVPKNTPTSGDVVSTFMFVDKTKHEYDVEIAQNASDITTINGYLPNGYTPIVVSTTNGIINKWGQIASPLTGWDYADISVTGGEKYKISGAFYGGNFPFYVILNGSTVLSYYNPSDTGAVYNEVVELPSNATNLVVNGSTASPVTAALYGKVKANSAEPRDSVVVGVGNEYTYTSIETAVTNNGGSIVTVDYGTYETEVSGLSTNKTIIGKDKDLCILTGTNKDYDTPPIEIAGGIIKNFTITMDNDPNADHKGYCLHSDDAACASNTLLVENCSFTCDSSQHSVGMGIYPNEVVLFKDCYFENTGSESVVPIYMHNSGSSSGVATVKFHNCYFVGEKYAMLLQGWGSNASINFEFIDCTCTSTTYGTADDCVWTDYVSGDTHDSSRMHEFSGKFALLPTSHGNNVSVLNA